MNRYSTDRLIFQLDNRSEFIDYNLVFKNAYERGNDEIVKILIDRGLIDPSINDGRAIVQASRNGHDKVVELLLKDPRVDPNINAGAAIVEASMNGHVKVVELLLKDPRVDPSLDENSAITMASIDGRTEVFKILFADPRVDPSDQENFAISYASKYGHIEIVKLLLTDPRVDPTADQDMSLREAYRNNHFEIVKLLREDKKKYPNHTIRYHNVKLENQIQNLKNELNLLEDTRTSYVQLLRAMSMSKRQVNPDYMQGIGVQIDILESEMATISRRISSLRHQQNIFYRDNLVPLH